MSIPTALQTIEAILRAESSYALDMKFSRAFAELTGRSETSVLFMVRGLTERNMRSDKGRGKYERAVRCACEQIWDWYQSFDQFPEPSTSTTITRLESHDPAHIWAVMLGYARRV